MILNEKTFNEKKIISSVEKELSDVYADFNFKKVEKSNEVQNMRLVDSISDGLKEAMYKNNSLIIMGQDIAEYGGVFKITEGFVDLFGKDRVELELFKFLSHDFVPRYGGGIGVTRMIRALKLSNLL